MRVKDTNILKSEMIKLFAKYVTARKDKLEVNKKLPRDYLHIELPQDKKDAYLFELMDLCIKTGAIAVTGTDELWWQPKYVFQMSGENNSKDEFIAFLSKHEDIKFEESGEK